MKDPLPIDSNDGRKGPLRLTESAANGTDSSNNSSIGDNNNSSNGTPPFTDTVEGNSSVVHTRSVAPSQGLPARGTLKPDGHNSDKEDVGNKSPEEEDREYRESATDSGHFSLPRSERLRRNGEDADVKAKTASSATLVSGGLLSAHSRHELKEAFMENAAINSEDISGGSGGGGNSNMISMNASGKEDFRCGAFFEPGIEDSSLLDLDNLPNNLAGNVAETSNFHPHVRLSTTSETPNLLRELEPAVTSLPATAMDTARVSSPEIAVPTPVASEVAPDPEDLEARIDERVAQQFQLMRQDFEARHSIPQNDPVVAAQVMHVEDEAATRVEADKYGSPNSSAEQGPHWYKAALIIMALTIIAGIGAGVWIVVRDQDRNSTSTAVDNNAENGIEVQRTILTQPPTENKSEAPKIARSATPTAVRSETPTAMRSDSPSTPPTSMPSTPPTATLVPSQSPTVTPQSDNFFALLDVLAPRLAQAPTFHNRTYLQDRSTVQYQMLDWMANHENGLSFGLEINTNFTYSLLERYTLGVAYHSLDGPSWSRQSNFFTGVPVCFWNDFSGNVRRKGVSCTDGIVTTFGFDENSMSGSLPPELFHLTMLESFVVNSNSITGKIPTGIGMLSNAQEFFVSGNSITGNIPTEIGEMTSVLRLTMNNNQLNGPLPSEIGNMESLLYFFVYSNEFTGTVPSDLRQLTQLTTFSFDFNQITGDVDPAFCNGTTLIYPPGGRLNSDCLVARDGTPARTNCTCCTKCCDVYGECILR